MRKIIASLLVIATLAVPVSIFANEMSNSTWSETDASNNAAVPNGMPEGMNPSGVNDAGRAMMGGLKRWWNRSNAAVTSAGASGHYTYATSNASFPTAYVQGESYCFRSDKNSAGNDDFAVNALGAKNLYQTLPASSATRILATSIRSGVYCVTYDGGLNGGSGGFWLQNPVPTAPAQVNVLNLAPTGTTSAGFVMMGMGQSGCVITPVVSGTVQFTVSGVVGNNAGNASQFHLKTGSGSAPANGAANTGTQLSTTQFLFTPSSLGTGFSMQGVQAGLTLGTAVWFDSALLAAFGGTAAIQGGTCSAVEIP